MLALSSDAVLTKLTILNTTVVNRVVREIFTGSTYVRTVERAIPFSDGRDHFLPHPVGYTSDPIDLKFERNYYVIEVWSRAKNGLSTLFGVGWGNG